MLCLKLKVSAFSFSFARVSFWWSVVKLVLRGLLRLDFCPGFEFLTPGG
jgi:hypothetical protein